LKAYQELFTQDFRVISVCCSSSRWQIWRLRLQQLSNVSLLSVSITCYQNDICQYFRLTTDKTEILLFSLLFGFYQSLSDRIVEFSWRPFDSLRSGYKQLTSLFRFWNYAFFPFNIKVNLYRKLLRNILQN